MAKKNKDYFGLDYVLSLVLVIIPITSWCCGILARFQDKHYVAAIIRIFFGFNIIWILDIVFMIKDRCICRLLEM